MDTEEFLLILMIIVFLPMIIKVLIFYQVSKLNQKMCNRNKGKRNLVENYLNRK